MPRYRVKNAYLSEQEYGQHISGVWSGCIILAGVIISCLACYHFILDAHFALTWSHSLKFTILALAFILGAIIFSLMRHVLRAGITMLFALSITAGIVYGIVMLIWKIT
jgi:hypothetical protein